MRQQNSHSSSSLSNFTAMGELNADTRHSRLHPIIQQGFYLSYFRTRKLHN